VSEKYVDADAHTHTTFGARMHAEREDTCYRQVTKTIRATIKKKSIVEGANSHKEKQKTSAPLPTQTYSKIQRPDQHPAWADY
jgi:hypothetical protein